MRGWYSTDGSRFDQHYGSGARVLSEDLRLIFAMNIKAKKELEKKET